MEKKVFKKGDKVFDIFYGWGEITNIIEDESEFEEYPIRVNFPKKGVILSYMKDGKFEVNDNFPRLSLAEYTLQGFSQERPINYEVYIGKWGRFFDKNEIHIAIDKLVDYHDGSTDAPFESRFAHYSNFEPLTEEQLKILNLK